MSTTTIHPFYSCPMGRLYTESNVDALAQFSGPLSVAASTAAAAARAMNHHDEMLAAARTLAEGWLQRNHPDSPGITITDEQMADAAYDVRATIAAIEG